jgi:hypothetical protein
MRQLTAEAGALAATPDGEHSDWLLPPFFMLRIAGLPVQAVAGLRAGGAAAWAGELLDTERLLSAGKDELAGPLEAAVGRAAGDAVRRQLLEIKRSVFNLRLPRNAGNLGGLAGALDDGALRLLRDWVALRRHYEAELARGPGLLAAELHRCRQHLRELGSHSGLRAGILLASPSLDTHLSRYLGAEPGPLSKRERRQERSLLEYVYRTAYKTSPFSTLTAVALGRFEPGSGAVLAADVPPQPWRSHTRLNLASLGRIGDAMVASPDLLADLPVRVTSGWRLDADRIRYVRRQRLPGDEDAAVTMDVLQENLFYLMSGTFLEDLLAIAPGGSTIRFGDLAQRLHEADPERRGLPDVRLYLGHLVRLGLLTIPALHLDSHHPDPVRHFRDRIAGLDAWWSADLAARLDELAGLAGSYREAPLDKRRALLTGIREGVVGALRLLGRDEATAPRTALYEDVSLGDAAVTADPGVWAGGLIPALTGLSRMLPVFDLTLSNRFMAKGFFRARFGRGGTCADLAQFTHDFHLDVYDQYLQYNGRRRMFDDEGEYVRQVNWFHQPEVEALDDARIALVRQMRSAYAALPPRASELVLDDAFIDGVAAKLPGCLGDLDPRSFFLQVANVGGQPLGVVNRVYSGLTLLFSRFAHCFADAGDDCLPAGLRAALAGLQPEGAVFAELTGGYDTANLNAHPSLLPYELVCPGDVSFRPPAEQIAVDDLIITDDPAADRLALRSRRLGCEVIPVYLGFLMPLALPEIQRLLLTFSYTTMAQIDLWSGTDKPLGDAPIGGHPRVRYRNLIVQRQVWKTDPARVPARAASQSDAEWFLSWARWRREHSLPRWVFATPDAPMFGERPAAGAAPVERKPHFVDFEDFLSLTLLDNLIKAAGRRLVLVEMLPDPGQLWLRSGTGHWVTELTVELDGRRRTA